MDCIITPHVAGDMAIFTFLALDGPILGHRALDPAGARLKILQVQKMKFFLSSDFCSGPIQEGPLGQMEHFDNHHDGKNPHPARDMPVLKSI